MIMILKISSQLKRMFTNLYYNGHDFEKEVVNLKNLHYFK